MWGSYSRRPCGRAIANGGALFCRRQCIFGVVNGVDSNNARAGIPGSTETTEPADAAASSRTSAAATNASNALAAHHDSRARHWIRSTAAAIHAVADASIGSIGHTAVPRGFGNRGDGPILPGAYTAACRSWYAERDRARADGVRSNGDESNGH
jgi:hypothetical protein